MIKVCHMTSAHQPGDTRIFQKECVSLAKAGYQVFLVQRGESGENSGVRIIGVGQPSGGRLTRMTSFARKVYEAALAFITFMIRSCFPTESSSSAGGKR